MQTRQVYLIGIGGIGMSNLARYYRHEGLPVAGYDRTRSELCLQLEAEGIDIHYEDNVALIPALFKDPAHTLVIRTPAIPASHSEWRYFEEQGFTIMKRAAVLGEISRDKRALCVSGTHGKTTTSTLLAHLLRQSSVDCNAFLGGISKNYGTNLLLSDRSDLTVIEADEYDRSFHHLRPYMAVVTSTDADHLDIYGTHEAYLESFAHFTELVRPDGCLLVRQGLLLHPRPVPGVRCYSYATECLEDYRKADFHSDHVQVEDGRLYFDFHYPGGLIEHMELGVPMLIHVENATAAMALAWLNGLSEEELRRGLASFRGNLRRFDIQVRRPDLVYIDDYAHHPDELRASIASLRFLFPDRRLTGIFQPHLYSRTRDFAAEFAAALSQLDEVILLDIYPAREEPIPGVTSQIIYDRLTTPHRHMTTLDNVTALLDEIRPEVLATLGAGNIDSLVPILKEKYSK